MRRQMYERVLHTVTEQCRNMTSPAEGIRSQLAAAAGGEPQFGEGGAGQPRPFAEGRWHLRPQYPRALDILQLWFRMYLRYRRRYFINLALMNILPVEVAHEIGSYA